MDLSGLISFWKNKRIVISGIAVLCAAALSAGLLYRSDRMVLRRSFRSLVRDMDEVFGNVDNRKSYVNRFLRGNTHCEYRLDVSGLPGIDMTIGTDGTLDRDYPEKKLSALADLSVMNYHIRDCEVMAEDNEVYITITDKSVENYLIDLDSFSDTVNSSEEMKELGVRVPDNMKADLFADPEEIYGESIRKQAEAVNKILNSGRYKNRIYEDGEKISFETGNGEILDCTVYHLDVSEGGNDVAVDITSSTNETPPVDITIDRSGNIRTLEGTLTQPGNSGLIRYKILFEGDDIPARYLTLSFGNISPENIFHTDDMENLNFYIEFEPSYIEETDTLSIICDRMVLSAGDDDLVRIRGSLTLTPGSGITGIERPSEASDIIELIRDIHEELNDSKRF